MMMMSLIVLAETKNRSQSPYIPLGRYIPYKVFRGPSTNDMKK
jgi:hypothetical protein